MNQGTLEAISVIHWIGEAWMLIPPIFFVRSWKRFLDHKATHQYWEEGGDTETQADVPETDENDVDFGRLLEKLPSREDASFEDLEEWMKNYFYLTEGLIVQIATN